MILLDSYCVTHALVGVSDRSSAWTNSTLIVVAFGRICLKAAADTLRGLHRNLGAVAFYDPRVAGYAVATCLNSDR